MQGGEPDGAIGTRTSKWTRRSTLGGLAAWAGAGLAGFGWETAAAEPPPETARIRILFDPEVPILCYAPQVIASELLRQEGFEEVVYAPYGEAPTDWETLASDVADISAGYGSDYIIGIDNNAPLTVLGGVHPGCVELIAGDRVADLSDLAGKRMVVTGPGSTQLIFLSLLLRYVGIDPERDIDWVYESDRRRWPEMLRAGDTDVVNAFPPQTLEMRAQGIGRVILNTGTDAPWRNFFCCLYTARSDFVRGKPIATKRALRALLKANDLCRRAPDVVARRLVETGAARDVEIAGAMLDELPYGAWRDYDPAATVRFFALRLREAGLIRASPQEVLERRTDFRILAALRRELKT